MTAHPYSLTVSGIASAILGKRLPDPKPATAGDLIEFVKAHPSNPFPNIRICMAIMFGAKEDADLSQIKRRLTYQLPIMKAQIARKHWAANPDKLSAALLVLDLIDEFEGEA